ncbi:MAG: hypothetical protein NTY00_03060 [Deltaproteobacteria bacterium]|nr:hypothetical protein [Deltaproteobacteria bacterium]
MERKKIVRKRSGGRKKRKLTWLNARKIIPFSLLFFLLLFSMAAAGYVIFFRATPMPVTGFFTG